MKTTNEQTPLESVAEYTLIDGLTQKLIIELSGRIQVPLYGSVTQEELDNITRKVNTAMAIASKQALREYEAEPTELAFHSSSRLTGT